MELFDMMNRFLFIFLVETGSLNFWDVEEKTREKTAQKTGTKQNNSDGWFIGVTPQLVTGVWSGCEDRSAHFRTIQYGQGANMALPVFAEYMKRVYADTSSTGFFPIDFDIPISIDEKFDCGNSSQIKCSNEFD